MEILRQREVDKLIDDIDSSEGMHVPMVRNKGMPDAAKSLEYAQRRQGLFH